MRPPSPASTSCSTTGTTTRQCGVWRPCGRARGTGEPPHIAYFRLFENAAGTTRFVRSWSTVGSVCLLRSADQVAAEELQAAEAAGSVASMFISTPAQLDAALGAPTVVDQGHAQRAMLCHGNFWRTAVDLLPSGSTS